MISPSSSAISNPPSKKGRAPELSPTSWIVSGDMLPARSSGAVGSCGFGMGETAVGATSVSIMAGRSDGPIEVLAVGATALASSANAHYGIRDATAPSFASAAPVTDSSGLPPATSTTTVTSGADDMNTPFAGSSSPDKHYSSLASKVATSPPERSGPSRSAAIDAIGVASSRVPLSPACSAGSHLPREPPMRCHHGRWWAPPEARSPRGLLVPSHATGLQHRWRGRRLDDLDHLGGPALVLRRCRHRQRSC